jgi:hypothetical protein
MEFDMVENTVRRVRKTIPVDPVVEAAPPPEPKPVQPAAPKPVFYRARLLPIHHPYQGILIPVHGQVPLYLDNWLECQLKAGIVEAI